MADSMLCMKACCCTVNMSLARLAGRTAEGAAADEACPPAPGSPPLCRPTPEGMLRSTASADRCPCCCCCCCCWCWS
jgi:hypothetical protein